ncbi:MAG: DUF5615 family PIN-like protein [Fimbriimonadaceae bacterium]
MRILLDENVRPAFAEHLVGHEVVHVEDLSEKGIGNGDLLKLAREQFQALVTLDRGILYQHPHEGYELIIAVLRVPDSTLESLLTRLAALQEFLGSAQPGERREITLGE